MYIYIARYKLGPLNDTTMLRDSLPIVYKQGSAEHRQSGGHLTHHWPEHEGDSLVNVSFFSGGGDHITTTLVLYSGEVGNPNEHYAD